MGQVIHVDFRARRGQPAGSADWIGSFFVAGVAAVFAVLTVAFFPFALVGF